MIYLNKIVILVSFYFCIFLGMAFGNTLMIGLADGYWDWPMFIVVSLGLVTLVPITACRILDVFYELEKVKSSISGYIWMGPKGNTPMKIHTLD